MYVCTGCGHKTLDPDADLNELQDKGHIACCPERNMQFDSTDATLEHINQVRKNLQFCINELKLRAILHDASKLKEPEKSSYDKLTPALKSLTYGSDEYRATIKHMKPAIDHHYANNSHHPEHYPNGVDDMDLFDVIEMVCDWLAAVKRHNDGNIYESLEINTKRFNLSPQLVSIIRNTIYKGIS